MIMLFFFPDRMYYVYIVSTFREDVIGLWCFSFHIGCNMFMLFLFSDRMNYVCVVSLFR
jgi:hypothetical protein